MFAVLSISSRVGVTWISPPECFISAWILFLSGETWPVSVLSHIKDTVIEQQQSPPKTILILEWELLKKVKWWINCFNCCFSWVPPMDFLRVDLIPVPVGELRPIICACVGKRYTYILSRWGDWMRWWVEREVTPIEGVLNTRLHGTLCWMRNEGETIKTRDRCDSLVAGRIPVSLPYSSSSFWSERNSEDNAPRFLGNNELWQHWRRHTKVDYQVWSHSFLSLLTAVLVLILNCPHFLNIHISCTNLPQACRDGLRAVRDRSHGAGYRQ